MPEKSTALSELEALQLEEARAQADERKSRRVALKKRVEAIEQTIQRDKQNRDHIQAACQHRKGGSGLSNFYNGNSQNYAIVVHRCSHGKTIVICQRCGKLWREPTSPGINATKEQKEKYRAELAEFRYARNLPTDNQPSGSAIFSFTSAEEEYA